MVRWFEVEAEAVGPQAVELLSRLHSPSGGQNDGRSSDGAAEEEKESTVVIDLDLDYLRSLDPKEWKSQDHYAVLGIKNLRFEATSSDIKSAYRQAVLSHHPDKRKGRGERVDQESDYFTCITAAWETLGDEAKRRAYDSVDPEFDDDTPSATPSTPYTDQQFYRVFGEAFKRNSRWSEKKPVPELGCESTPRAQVEGFYSFWYDFQSWREYSYQDEESKDKGQDRDERRWIEKQNRVVRAKKKKEEMSRIRGLVDLAYELDPRVRRFRAEDRERKEETRRAKAKAAADRQLMIDRARKEEEEEKRRVKESEEAEERAKQNALKAEREAAKKNMRKEKKTLRDLCKLNRYYSCEGEEEAENMRCVELLCESLSLEEMRELNSNLKEVGRPAFRDKVAEVEKRVEQERLNSVNSWRGKERGGGGESGGGGGAANTGKWTEEMTGLLIKGVNLFPAGTAQRWEVVANFINQHRRGGDSGVTITSRDVLVKAKDMQNSGEGQVGVRQAANRKAFENFEKQKKNLSRVDEVETSRRFEDSPWTCEEQRLLEQALKTHPATAPDRWDNIAAAIPSRTKKDCMKRYKELVEMVKAKKMALQTVSAS